MDNGDPHEVDWTPAVHAVQNKSPILLVVLCGPWTDYGHRGTRARARTHTHTHTERERERERERVT